MRRLMLLRHAKSDWAQPGTPDTTRPLNARGEAAARLMGGYMARHALVPGRVLCSPSRRTRETLAGLAAQWPAGVEIMFEERLYAAAAAAILAAIQAQHEDAHDDRHDAARTLLVIGHNPGLHEAAEFLIAAGDVGLRERLREKFPTAALAVIDFAVDRWDLVRDRCGRLDRYVTPRSIAAATN